MRNKILAGAMLVHPAASAYGEGALATDDEIFGECGGLTERFGRASAFPYDIHADYADRAAGYDLGASYAAGQEFSLGLNTHGFPNDVMGSLSASVGTIRCRCP